MPATAPASATRCKRRRRRTTVAQTPTARPSRRRPANPAPRCAIRCSRTSAIANAHAADQDPGDHGRGHDRADDADQQRVEGEQDRLGAVGVAVLGDRDVPDRVPAQSDAAITLPTDPGSAQPVRVEVRPAGYAGVSERSEGAGRRGRAGASRSTASPERNTGTGTAVRWPRGWRPACECGHPCPYRHICAVTSARNRRLSAWPLPSPSTSAPPAGTSRRAGRGSAQAAGSGTRSLRSFGHGRQAPGRAAGQRTGSPGATPVPLGQHRGRRSRAAEHRDR